MAKYWTWAEIRTKIQRDCDIEAEDFIQPDELVGYVNEAIDEAESHIHQLGMDDDYFLTFQDYGITTGQQELELPSDIYAHKIRGIAFTKGDLIYQIKRFRGGEELFETIANAEHFTNVGDYYKYILVNDNSDSGATPAPKLRIIPKFRETIAASPTPPIKLWYIRNAYRFADAPADTEICDLPEFVHFVIKYVKFMIYYKEGHPNVSVAKQELEQERARMVSTLQTMIPDKDSKIMPDLDYYNEIT